MREITYIDSTKLEEKAYLMVEDVSKRYGLVFVPDLGVLTIAQRVTISKFKHSIDTNTIWLSESDKKELLT